MTKPQTLPQPLPMKRFYQLIVDLVEDATGMPRDSIYWSEQDANQAEYPFCALNLISPPSPISNDDDRVQTDFDNTKIPGTEVTVDHRVPMLFTVSARFEVGPGINDDGLDDNANPECNAPALATALNPYLGYDRVATLVKEARKADITVKELVLKKKIMTRKQLDTILDPEKLTSPNLKKKS